MLLIFVYVFAKYTVKDSVYRPLEKSGYICENIKHRFIVFYRKNDFNRT